ncbi:MAG TPA: YebC/PmpR family DNA-binding transcriptional regulator [Pirellulales bacterium]|jgi:YebC/PmpR family DNA-binding regulatory protein|nr:YebC/PmpR family DNA-binding transcriptional regulator [Pirellulales bacterium]
MAGHSHWANIARKKSLIDNKRGKLWSKLAKGIIVAAKMGGGDPAANLKLRYAIDAAKAVSMPRDNIERAIKAGTGESKAGSLEEMLYEGYGPGGVAVLCEILTDNRNRTAPEIRKIFELTDGKLGETGCVSWMFERKGLFRVSASKIDEDSLMELALEAGADDVKRDGDEFEVTCDPSAFQAVGDALEAKGIGPESRELTRIPTNTIDLDADIGRKVLSLVQKLDDHDDVQRVVANFNIPEEAMAEIGNG